MFQRGIARAGVAGLGFASAALSVALLAAPASAQSISKQGFNNNVPGCPVDTTNVINTQTFSDGSPLPSCGGRIQKGNTITTYKMVWTGKNWAKYPPSIKTTVVSAAPAKPPVLPSLTYRAPTTQINVSAATFNSLPTGGVVNTGLRVYFYQGQWYSLVASGGGNVDTLALVATGGGNLKPDARNIVSTNGGNILLNGGANLTHYMSLVGTSGGTLQR